MSFGIPVRNGLSISLLSTTALSTGRRLIPALGLNFLSGTLDPRITFSRGSNATLTDSTGKITYAPTNLLTNSESFDNASWGKTGATVTANTATAPDSTLTADTLTTTVTGNPNIQQIIAAPLTGIRMMFSYWVRAGTSSETVGQLFVNSGVPSGTVAITGGIVSGPGTADLTNAATGNLRVFGLSQTEWTRVVLIGTSTSTSGNFAAYIKNRLSGGQVGDTTFIWGAQLSPVTYQTTPGTYNSTTPKNLLGFTQEFDNAAWTKSNAYVQTNLLLYSQQLGTAPWENSIGGTGATPTTTNNAGVAPDGTSTATRLQLSLAGGTTTSDLVRRRQPVTLSAVQYVYSVWIKSTDGSSTYNIHLQDAANATRNISVTGTWTRYEVSATAVGGTAYVSVGLRGGQTPANSNTADILVWGAQLVQGSTAGDYQRTDAAAAAVQYYAPDGTLSADKLVETTAAGNHQATATAATLASPNAYSVYAKAGERSWMALGITDSGSTVRVTYFDLANGVVGTTATGVTASIVSVGNGWYRCSAIVAAALAGSNTARVYVTNADNATSYTGDGTSGIYIWGAQLSDSASLDPYVYNPAAAAASAAYYGPRFDYDPVTLAAKGLLIEEQRTNLRSYSQELDNAVYTKSGSSVSVNATSAPDGTATADKLVEDSANTAHGVITFTPATSTAYVISFYAKPAGRSRIQFSGGGFGAQGFVATFNVSDGTMLVNTGNKGTITAAGNGWYRCAIAFTTSNTSDFSILMCNDAGASTYQGDGTSGIYLWGTQIEAGSFATSYIPTVASQVTRSADVATMIGDNFRSWYNQNAGTFVVEADTAIITGDRGIISANDGSGNNDIDLRASSSPTAVVASGGASQAILTVSGAVVGTPTKLALAYALNDFAAVRNGGTVAADTSGTTPAVNQMQIGNLIGSTLYNLNGHIRSLGYYNTRQPNATLQTLTNPSTTPSLALNFISDTYTVGA